MPHVCPRPCSRLATAAVFISVGAVQFIAGIIMLRSDYVYLLAGPDFWTACSNIAVGCLLGASASVWKQSRKRQSMKHVVRRNILLAMMFSALIINSTTLAILLLGKGHTMLSIQLEGDGGVHATHTFVNEVLAYAYATSVCSPIVCIVISIVSMAGNCFTASSRNISSDMKIPLSSNLKRKRSQSLQWVYTPEMLAIAKNNSRQDVLTSSSDSSSEESCEEDSTPQEYSSSVEDLQSVLHRMAEGKRDRILNDSTVMLKQLDLRRKNRYDSVPQDGSYMGPSLSRMRESTTGERKCSRDDSGNFEENSRPINSRIYRNSVTHDGHSSRVSYGDVTLERIVPPRRLPENAYLRNQFATDEEALSNYQNYSSQLAAKNFHAQYRNFKENLQNGSEIDGTRKSRSSEDVRPKFADAVAVHKAGSRMTVMEDNSSDLPSEYHSFKRLQEMRQGSREIREENSTFRDASKFLPEETSQAANDCFSPSGSEFEDTFDLSRTSSWAGEIVPISVSSLSAARVSQKLTPVLSPVVPEVQQFNAKSSPVSVESTSNTKVIAAKGERSHITSFRENIKPKKKEAMGEYPKAGQQSGKKYDLSRVVTMTSISEEPNSETGLPIDEATRSALYREISEVSKKRAKQLKKSYSTAYSDCAKQDRDCASSEDITPKRKTAASCKSLRKKIWSTSSSKDLDLKDQVMDEDSLIGLSEDELIARQNRIRFIRKTIQKRVKVREMAF